MSKPPRYIPQLKIPRYNIDEQIEFICACISSWPEYNITEKVSEWAEKNRSIGKGLTANPGKFSFDLTPYMIEVVDNLSDNSPILETFVQKGTQIGYNVAVSQNHIGYCIEYGIGPGLFVGGDQDMAEDEMEKRVDEMIEESGLQGKIKSNIKKKHDKTTGDRKDSKSYGGTFMRAVGPNSEAKARSFPARWVHFDEMSSYRTTTTKDGKSSGNVVEKVIRRQDTYGTLKKTLGGSTPHLAGSSIIDELVDIGDKRLYNIKCPKCGAKQPLVWNQFKWDKTDEGKPDIKYKYIDGIETIEKDPVYYECNNSECNHHMRDEDKEELMKPVQRGGSAEWVPTKKPTRPFVRSYFIPAWYGFRSWLDIVLEFYEKKDDPFKFPDFVNNVMAETWKESDQKPDDNFLMQLAQEFEQWPRGHIKRDVLFLTLACDVQKDRLEAGIIGWGRNRQGYMIDYWTFDGDPSMVEDKCWKQLDEKIRAKYKREDGQELYVSIAFIDSQYLSDTVDMFCDGFPYVPGSIEGVFPVQSRETQDKIVKNFKSNIKTPVVGMHDQELKRALYNILRKRPQGPGHFPGYYLHFSMDYGPEFYKQLTAEEIEVFKVRGIQKGIKIVNSKQRRNETLDVVKMNMAAFQYGMDMFFAFLNDAEKLQKEKLTQENAEVFFDAIENMLYELV